MKSEIFSDQSFESPLLNTDDDFEIAVHTCKSPLKDTPNEDSVGYVHFENGDIILMVADGAGGHPKGEVASNLVLGSIEASLSKANKKGISDGFRNHILDGIEDANRSLLEEGSGSKTTVSVCEIRDGRARAYQVGDSGVLICGQRGKQKYKTIFHSPVGYGVEAGLIPETEALAHPNLNEIANIVGDHEMTIELGPLVDLGEKDTILIASDGVFDNFKIEELTEIIRKGSLEQTGLELSEFFESRLKTDPEGRETKYDDMSFILYRRNSKK